ncbi:MAG TPA: trehalose-phosphatase [Gemmatimonadaceae bacterium]|jgi:trehalose 6-phosphate phosphatase|nr:trehalose-phosphatase [Gemmatimonadaceae bacterium]
MTRPALPMTPELAARLDGRPLMLFLDIDGTLSPIAPRPDIAVVPAATQRLLKALAHAPDVHVAVISGRSVSDARRLVGVAELWTIGNHGFEVAPPDQPPSVSENVLAFAEQVRAAGTRAIAAGERVPGVVVEDKHWTLSVHYRMADPDAVPKLADEVHAIAREYGLVVTHGKKIFELRPPVRIDKGSAALELAGRLGALHDGASLLAAGDDRTDEDMFRALRERMPSSITIRVGEDASAQDTAAEFRVPDPAAMREVLEILSARRARVGAS